MTPGHHCEDLGARSPAFSAGQLVAGRYRIIRFVNRGGMGEVYEAEDLELGETIALKTLLPEIASDPRNIARFKQEIQLSRKVSHPNVCRVFDLVRQDDVCFLTMEFVHGETLQARLDRDGPLSPEEALPLFDRMAAALDAAHSAGVIHRDFKPSNVMLSPRDGVPHVVVTDFGLARRTTAVNSQDETQIRTRPGRVDGTPGYLAPEVLRGAAPGPAADLYALGVTAYRVITGRMPAGRCPTAGTPWASAIERAMLADPGARFASAGEFIEAIREWPAGARPPTRRAWLAWPAAVVLAAAGWSGWKTLGPQAARPSPEAQRYYALGAAHLEAAAYFAATKALERAVSMSPNYCLAHARLAEAWLELEIPENAGIEMLKARAAGAAGLSALDRLRIAAIEATITRDFPLAESRYEEMLSKARANRDEIYLDLGRVQEKEGHIPDALKSYTAASEANPGNAAAWMRRAALDARAPTESSKADDEFRKAEESYQLISNLEGLTELAYQRSVAANRRNEFDAATGFANKVIETAQITGNVHQQIRGRLQLANTAVMKGEAAQADTLARAAIATAETNHIDSLAIRGLLILGNAYARKLDFAAAERRYSEALELARRNGTRRLEAPSLLSLASVHSRTGRPDDALREARAAFDFFSPNHFARESLQCLTLIGRVQRDRGDASAVETFRTALRIAESAQDAPQMAVAHESLGELLKEQERLPDSLAHYEKSVRLSVGAEQTGWAFCGYGDTLWMLGRIEEAGAAFDRVEPTASHFPDLKLAVATSRANMALARRRFSEAASRCRRALPDARRESETASLNVILGLALVRSGQRADGLRACRLAAAACDHSGAVSLRLAGQLALAEALLASGESAAALDLVHRLQPLTAGLPLSRLQLLAIAARAGGPQSRADAEAALGLLDTLRRDWGDATFETFRARPDMQALWIPLARSANAAPIKGETK
jgi:tetratricopeptide (TPR) repeat protein